MMIRNVMTPGAACVSADATLTAAAKHMKELDVGALPVCENDRLVGMITDRDIVIRSAADGHDPKAHRVRDVMTADVVYCFDDQDADEAARLMGGHQIRRLPVLNRSKRLVGMVSLGDLAVRCDEEHTAAGTLEEVSAGPPNR